MPCQLEEGTGQGLPCSGSQGRIGAPKILFLSDGGEEPFGHIPFGGGPDPGVLLQLAEGELVLQLIQSPIETLEHLPGFLGDLGKLTVREPGKVGHIDLAVIPEGQKRRPLAWGRSLTAAVPGLLGGGRVLPNCADGWYGMRQDSQVSDDTA